MKYCPYCGAGLQDEMLFCPSCGKKYVGAASSPTSHADSAAHTSGDVTDPSTAPSADAAPAKKKRPRIWLFAALSLFVVVAVCFLFFGRSAPSKSKPTPEITPEPTPEPLAFSDDTAAIQRASDSVIMLSCYDRFGDLYATGSAFAAFEDGIFVTNFHVIQGNVWKVMAKTESGNEFEVDSIIVYDEERDVAILRARDIAALRTHGDTKLPPLPLCESDALEKGTKVVAIGSPLGLLNSVSTGVYSGTVRDGEQDYLQFSAAISHGSSGGALFNDAGEVIGVTSGSYTSGQNVNLALPIQFVSRFWSLHQNDTPQTIRKFYDSRDHIFDVDYVIAHTNFDGESIQVQGYISSVFHYSDYDAFFLVGSSYDVFGYRDSKDASKEESRVYSLASIYCHTEETIPVIPGDFVVLKGKAFFVSGENPFVALEVKEIKNKRA